MKSVYGTYMSILKAFVSGKQWNIEADTDWQKLFQLAQINGTSGIVGSVLMQQTGAADQELRKLGRQQCLGEIALYSKRAVLMKELIRRMNEKGIDHLLFKGYIVRDYYPVPELRTFNDVDFVIRKEDRVRSDLLMTELGFETHEDWEPVYSYVKGIEYYEIHTEVMEIDVSNHADYMGYFREIWKHAVRKNEHTYELTPEFHFLYLLTHIAKHINSSGAGIRMYLDLAFFIRHFENTLDWDYICEQFRVLKFEQFGNLVLTAIRKWFGVEGPIVLQEVSDEVLEDFLDFTLEGGVFGKVGRDASMKYLKNQDRESESVSKAAVLLKRMFPSAKSLEKRYTYLQGKRFLLPIAWVHRLFKTKSTWKEHAAQAKNIMNADEERVLRLRMLYKEIGL